MYKFLFLDDTWIFQDDTLGRFWQNGDKRNVKTIKTDRRRYIVIHGYGDGFIEGAELLFSSKNLEMNEGNFLNWFENQLLNNFCEPSMIVLKIEDWLRTHDVPFDSNMFKTNYCK